MKKVFLVLWVAVAVGFAFVNVSFALEIDVEYNATKNLQQNLLSVTNLHTAYSAVGFGAEKIISLGQSEKVWWQRGLEIAVDGNLAYGVSVLGHEGGHDYYADRNGIGNRSISWSFYNGSTSYDLSYKGLSSTEKAKISSAGLVWNNRAAEESLVNQIGDRVIISEMLWYSANKISMPLYIGKSSDPDQSGSYGLSSSDTESWIRNIAGGNFSMMDSLYDDLKAGAIWQGLSLLAPAGASLYYMVTGNQVKVPNFWLDTESEMTDAGVMYALTGLYKRQGITYCVRAGYGKNRVQEGDMSQVEAEIRDIPLPVWDLKAKVKAGYAQTLAASKSVGLGLEKSFKSMAIGAEVNSYDGYHRYNPNATGGFTEVLSYVKFTF